MGSKRKYRKCTQRKKNMLYYEARNNANNPAAN
jgi:hypothetical protein